jgi:tetratricopeptide (TPR) repeat protein
MTRTILHAVLMATLGAMLGGCATQPKWSTSSPDAVRAYEQGVTHWERFYYVEAAASFTKAIAADTMFAVAWGRLALVHLNTLDEASARRECSRALALSGSATEREQLLIHLWYHRIMYDNARAAAAAESLIALYPREPEAFLFRGQMYEQEKNLAAAVSMYERAVAADTGFALGVMSLGYAYSNLGEQDKAVSYMQRYIRMAPDAADPRASYADILVRAGRYDEALEQYRASLLLKPDYWYSVRQTGGVYAVLGRLQDAGREFDRSLEMIPSGPSTNALRLRLHGYLDLQRGAYGETVRKCTEAIAIDSSLLGSAFNLTMALAKLKRFTEAEEYIRQSMEELRQKRLSDSPTMQGYHLMRARVLTEHRRFDEAEQACRSALEYSSPQMRGAVYSQLARAYLASGQYESALDAVEGALGVNPNAPDALMVLAKAYNEMGDRRMVIEVGQRLTELWKDADRDFLPLIELHKLLSASRTRHGK